LSAAPAGPSAAPSNGAVFPHRVFRFVWRVDFMLLQIRRNALDFPRPSTRPHGGAPARTVAKSAATSATLALLLAATLAPGPARGQEAPRKVLAVVTCDSYADLKKQLGWLGGQVGQPALAGMLESVLLMSTQGRGLGGLDVKRPLGAIVTTDGGDIAVHGFVPVKKLDELLDSLQSVTGPVEKSGDARSLVLPSGVALDIVERDGWAVVSPQAFDAKPVDPAPRLTPLADNYSLAIELFPSLLPEGLRQQLKMLVEQGAAQAAQQGQQVDPRALAAVVDAMANAESVVLGVTIDTEKQRVFIENRTVGVPGSPLALAMQGADKGRLTVAMPPAADGGRPAISGYLVQSVSPEARAAVKSAIASALPPEGGDALTGTIRVLLREVVDAVLASGGIDAAVAVDPSAAPADAAAGARQPAAMTAGVRVQNGPAVEAGLKKAFGPDGAARKALPPGVTLSFDTGKVATANLHTIRIDLEGTDAAEQLGKTLDLTLAVTPDFAFVLAGGKPQARLAALLGPQGTVDDAAKPIAGLNVDVPKVLAKVAGEAAAATATPNADTAGGVPPARMTLMVRPIERGLATRLSADGAALSAAAAAAQPPADEPAGVQIR